MVQINNLICWVWVLFRPKDQWKNNKKPLKKRKLVQVANQQQLELDIDCNGGCYYIITTNEEESLHDIHQFLLP
jgi:hypothetical protein